MEKIKYQGKIIEVVEKDVKHGERVVMYEIARRSPGVRIIVVKGDTILLTKEHRHEVGGYDMRLPGGKVYDTLSEYNTALESGVDVGEAAKRAAIKEAFEEAGIGVKEAVFFHKSVCGATVLWDLYYFVAEDFVETEQHLEEDEEISIEFVSKEKVKQMCLDGTISEERSALVLLRYLNG